MHCEEKNWSCNNSYCKVVVVTIRQLIMTVADIPYDITGFIVTGLTAEGTELEGETKESLFKK